MKKLALALCPSLLVLAVVPAMTASGSTPASSTPTLSVATGGTPRRTAEPAPTSFGYRPLHPDQLARAKALANSQAFGGYAKGNGHGKPGGGGTGPTVSTYSNVTPSFNASYQSGLAPPDTTGAIGNDRYIEAINTKYTIFSRAGSQINTGSLTSLTNVTTLPNNGYCFFPGQSPSHSDPQIMWDVATQRFYYADVWYDGTFLSCAGLSFGFSKTDTPATASDFCHYKVDFGGELPDYPKLGDSRDFILYGYNKFSGGGSSYDGSEFMTLNKPPAGSLSTCPAPSAFSLHPFGTGTLATPVPANLVDDSNGTGYVVTNPDLSTVSSTSTIRVYSVSWDGHTLDGSSHPNPSVSSASITGVASYSMPPNAPERGSSALTDTLDGRFEAAVAAIDPTAGRGIAVWTAHAVKSVDGLRSEERWYEINPSGSLYDHGAASSTSLFTWNGAISPDRNGSGGFGNSMAMSVSTSSSTTYPAIQFLWKKGGVQSSLNNLVQAGGPNIDFTCSPCRWGDYSGATPDPAATGTAGQVWLANQYNVGSSTSSDTDWRTWVFAVMPT